MKKIILVLSFLLLGTINAIAEKERNVLILDVAGENSGTIKIELLHEVAPLHVERIITLTNNGLYDNVAFHRVIEGFMAQTGDVQFGRVDQGSLQKAGIGSSDLPDLKAEFSPLPFRKGTVGMARAQNPNSANSQFFIMFEEAPFLNGQYTVFGRVISGQDVVDAIKRGQGQNGAVADPDYIASARIEE